MKTKIRADSASSNIDGNKRVGTGDLLAEGARYHRPASTFKKLFGGIGRHPEQNLRVISSDEKSVLFNADGRIDTMERDTFLRLARKTLAAGAQFFSANIASETAPHQPTQ